MLISQNVHYNVTMHYPVLTKRAWLHGRGEPQVGEVARLGGVTRMSIKSLTHFNLPVIG